MPRADPTPPGDRRVPEPGEQDLVILLLHGAVQASAALDQIRRLAPLAPDPASAALINEAIRLAARARANLLRAADQVGRTERHVPSA
ncbi:hypothetical protein [Actinoplanes sp. NPDC020271]|uniref:hypothetical protein n=1 Tax=Actinoplanes sp. NPDC020271 TaxID=3363896 RepID=UPI0037A6A40D